MMIHPEGVAVFVEVPKTGSTACTVHLRDKGKWFQNGTKGTAPIPGTFPGRHSFPNEETAAILKETGVTVYGVVRNPWDRMASLWRASAPGTTTFLEYMTTGKFTHNSIDIMTTPQHTWLKNADYTMRYESLSDVWDAVAEALGHLPKGPLPQINVSKRRAKPNWTQAEIDIVAQRFAKDIMVYGYEGPT